MSVTVKCDTCGGELDSSFSSSEHAGDIIIEVHAEPCPTCKQNSYEEGWTEGQSDYQEHMDEQIREAVESAVQAKLESLDA